MNVKETLLQRFDEGTIYGIDRKTIEDGHEFYFDSTFSIVINDSTERNNKNSFPNDNGILVKYEGTLFYIKFHTNLDFVPDYFHHTSLLTDGTLFVPQLVGENFNSIIGSYPSQYKIPSIDKIKSVTYTYSNPLITTEYGDFGTEEKPWLEERISCWTPIKFEYVLKEDAPNE